MVDAIILAYFNTQEAIMLISSDLFTWSKAKRWMITEASDIKGFIPGESFINIQSTRTNKIVKFLFHSTITDNEGEVGVWVYRPTQSSIDKDPKLAPVQIHILND